MSWFQEQTQYRTNWLSYRRCDCRFNF